MSIVRVNEFTAAAKRQLNFILFTNTYALYIAAKGCLSCELVKHHEHGEQFMIIERWDCIESH